MEFILGKKAGKDVVFQALAKSFTVRHGKSLKIIRTLFDTFDWRLYAAGQSLHEVHAGDRVTAEWRDSRSGKILGSMQGPVPAMARDWHPAPLAGALERIIKVRALLPLVSLQTVRSTADLLNDRNTPVARLAVEFNKIAAEGGAAVNHTYRGIRLSMVRNYSKAFREAERVLAGIPGLSRSVTCVPERLLSARGHAPLAYSSKVDVRLLPETPSEAAVRKVLLRLLEIMEANHAGMIADTDPEFLHDFRVAVRRTRSMLGQMKQAVPEGMLAGFKPELDWLGKLTGQVRDLDVYILKFQDYAASLDESIRGDLAPLKQYICRRQQREQIKLVRALSAGRYLKFAGSWKAALNTCWQSDAPGWKGADPIETVARQRILKIFKRALRQGRALKKDSPASAIHELRITCKKLRYLMEFFNALFLPEKTEPFIKTLRELQDTLGDFQDYEVHRTGLYTITEKMAAQATVGPPTVLAAWKLSETLAGRQNAARADIERLFSAFSSKKNTTRFRSIFRQNKKHVFTADDACDSNGINIP